MGNGIGGVKKNKRARIMKIDGETFKVKPPATAADVLKDYPAGHVLMESERVKKCGIRAEKLRPEEGLKPGRIYFLVEMPEFPDTGPGIGLGLGLGNRRAKSLPRGASSAKERLEGLMLLRNKSSVVDLGSGSGSGPVRVKMRLPRAEIEKLMRESKDEDEDEVGQRILDFCLKGEARLRG